MKKSVLFFGFGIALVILSLYFAQLRDTAYERDIEKYIEFKDIKSANDKAYIYLDILAYHDEYFTLGYSDNAPYVLKLDSLGDFSEDEILKKDSRLVGVSKEIDETMKEKIVLMHNGSFDDELDSVITTENVESIYGKYYLEVNELIDDSKLPDKPETLRDLSFNIGIALIIMGAFTLVIYIKRGKE
jgi:hypothetical protein